MDPELRRTIVELGMVRSVQVHEDQVNIELA
jgi:metal-sulfur cluster biosynthetic enzyme